MKPFCGETRLDLLPESYYTPNEIFYTRNHHHVPLFENVEEDYEFVVDDCPELGITGRSFTLSELKTLFPKAEVASVLISNIKNILHVVGIEDSFSQSGGGIGSNF